MITRDILEFYYSSRRVSRVDFSIEIASGNFFVYKYFFLLCYLNFVIDCMCTAKVKTVRTFLKSLRYHSQKRENYSLIKDKSISN